ncbi:MAG TPA: molybdate ABC transporter substrate-binding protein [Xanthobacteraceae bacterium]|nr:molybdate ABC transporter substrate-binding protein [Xanthobacteraceae bacterium]
MRLRCCAAVASALLLALPLLSQPAHAENKPVVIFAAASLKNALDEAAKKWTEKSGVEVKLSYAASSALARQIEAGAPADIFISADLDWMNYVDGKKLVKAGTRSNLLGNSIVLVANRQEWKRGDVKIAKGFDLAKLLGNDRLAMAAVKTVPAGKYGKAALEKLGVWDSVSNKLAQAENVRAALALVGRGEAPLGIVYKTDAAADRNVKIVGTFPDDSHKPIIYPAARLGSSNNAKAAALLKFLVSPEAKSIFERHGFTVLAAKPAG